MHAPPCQPAVQSLIERGMASRNPLTGGQPFATGNRGQVSPQHGKSINRLAHHLFLICSQVRFGPTRVKRMDLRRKRPNGAAKRVHFPANSFNFETPEQICR